MYMYIPCRGFEHLQTGHVVEDVSLAQLKEIILYSITRQGKTMHGTTGEDEVGQGQARREGSRWRELKGRHSG